MNTLPPLPLIDGCLFIDNSSWVESMSTCHRYLEYRSLRKRVASSDKPSLNFGSAVHLALEHRYRKYQNKLVDDSYYEEVSKILMDFYSEHPAPLDDWRTLNWAMEVVKRYNKKYQTEEFNLLMDDKGEVMVELSFALSLFEYKGSVLDLLPMEQLLQVKDRKSIPVFYTGRIDLPIHLDGQIFVMDHKTTGMLGQSFFDGKRLSSQQRGYAWAFQTLTGKPVAGFIVNAIRTKAPPQYVLDGKPSTRGTKTSPEQWWEESLQRERYQIKPGDLEEWKANTIDLVEEFFWHYQRGYMPMKTEWCVRYGNCPYYDVCRLAREDRGVMLASGLFTENTWSPLNQPTQSKQ